MNSGLELWNDKEIITTLTAPGTTRAALGGDIVSKIHSKNQCEEVEKQGWLFSKLGKLKEANAIS